MTQEIIIDGSNIHSQYDIVPLKGCFEKIISPPSLKAFPKTDWKDEHGIDYDTSKPVFDARKIEISLYSSSRSNFLAFLEFIHAQSTRQWQFIDIDRSYKFRIVSQSKVVQLGGGWWFSLSLSEDKPFLDYSYLAPLANSVEQGFFIDNKDISYWGIQLLKGCEQELYKEFSLKQNTSIQSKNIAGIEYYNPKVYFGTKSVKLPCLIEGLDKLRNLEALCYDLSRPKERLWKDGSLQMPFIYKDINVKEYYPNDWLVIELSIEFTNIPL